MPTWLKVVLIVIGVIILLVAAVGIGGYVWWTNNGESMMADARAAMDEGHSFGTGKDNWACVDEAAKRSKGIGFPGAVKTQLFLRACLEAGKPTPGFCDSVPGPLDFLKSVSWQGQLHQKYGLVPPIETTVLPQPIQSFCEEAQSKSPPR
jgi:hypothetical protein